MNELKKKYEWNQARIEELEAKMDLSTNIKRSTKQERLEMKIRDEMELEILKAHNETLQKSISSLEENLVLEDRQLFLDSMSETNKKLKEQYETLDIAVKQNVLATTFVNERKLIGKIVEMGIKGFLGGVIGIMGFGGIYFLQQSFSLPFAFTITGYNMFALGVGVGCFATMVETIQYKKVFRKLNSELGVCAIKKQKDREINEKLQREIQKTSDMQVLLQTKKYMLKCNPLKEQNSMNGTSLQLEDYEYEERKHSYMKNMH